MEVNIFSKVCKNKVNVQFHWYSQICTFVTPTLLVTHEMWPLVWLCAHMKVDVISDEDDRLLLDIDNLSVNFTFFISCINLFLNFSPTKAYSTGLTQLWRRPKLWVRNTAWSTATLAGHWYGTIFALKKVSVITARWYGVQQRRKATTTNTITFIARCRWKLPRMWRRRLIVIP